MLLHHQTAVTNFYDEEQIKTVYYPECERVMQASDRRRARRGVRSHRAQRGDGRDQGKRHQDAGQARPQRLHGLVFTPAGARSDGRRGRGVAEAPLRDHQSVAPDPRSVAGFAAGVVRRAEPRRGKPDRERPQISGPHGRDLFDHLQPKPALLLFREDAARRGRAPDPRSVAGVAAGIVRRAEPRRAKPDRQRPQIPRPHRRDLFDYL